MPRKQLFVYILRCADDSFYTGVTNNVERRVQEHNNMLSMTSYTASRLPVELVFYRAFNSAMKAIRFEKQIKGWRRAKKLALIEGRISDIAVLAKGYHGSSSSP